MSSVPLFYLVFFYFVCSGHSQTEVKTFSPVKSEKSQRPVSVNYSWAVHVPREQLEINGALSLSSSLAF